METLNIGWLQSLKRKKIIECIDTGLGKYHRIVNPSNFTIPNDKITVILEEYHPGIEKGGLFLFAYDKLTGTVGLALQDIVFIENVSTRPWDRYKPDHLQLREALMRAWNKQLIPCFFHSHPTEGPNILLESFNYNQQMNTSDLDKVASLAPTFKADYNLRLPQFLVVCNGSLKGGIFIGIYGGLVAPLSFTARKKDITDQFFEMVGNDVSQFFNTPQRKIVGGLTAVATIALCVKYPKIGIPLLTGAVAALPTVIYETPTIQEVFGVSHGSVIKIHLPQIDPQIVMEDERILHELKEKIRKDDGFNRVA